MVLALNARLPASPTPFRKPKKAHLMTFPNSHPDARSNHTPGKDSAQVFMASLGSSSHTPATSSAMSSSMSSSGADADGGNGRPGRDERLCMLVEKIETRLVEATWTLRRLPDRERGLLSVRGMIWPDAPTAAGDYGPAPMSAMRARRSARIDPKEIDRMQPTLDLLLLLPDLNDRKLLFWAAWHQDGEQQARLPWAKVRRSTASDQSRWTLKRRYENGLKWLASIILAQA